MRSSAAPSCRPVASTGRPTATTCVFPYEVTGVDDAAVYLVQVAERRPIRSTRAQVEADRGRIDVLLR